MVNGLYTHFGTYGISRRGMVGSKWMSICNFDSCRQASLPQGNTDLDPSQQWRCLFGHPDQAQVLLGSLIFIIVLSKKMISQCGFSFASTLKLNQLPTFKNWVFASHNLMFCLCLEELDGLLCWAYVELYPGRIWGQLLPSHEIWSPQCAPPHWILCLFLFIYCFLLLSGLL